MKELSFVYILTNTGNKVFYIGVTTNLKRRIWEHKNKIVEGFTAKYNVKKLVYFEEFESIERAIMREKQLKGGSRQQKLNLILKTNYQWRDLYEEM